MIRIATTAAALIAASSLVACDGADSAQLSEAERAASASAAEAAMVQAITDGSMVSAMVAAAREADPDADETCGTVTLPLHTVRPSERISLSGEIEMVRDSCPWSEIAPAPERGQWRMRIEAEVEAGAAAAAIAGEFSCLMGPGGVAMCEAQPGAMATVDTDRFVALDLASPEFAGAMELSDAQAGASQPGAFQPSLACFPAMDGDGEPSQICLAS